METPESGLKFLIVVFLSAILLAVFIKRRYGPVGKKLIEWMGSRWTLIIKIGSIATLVLWLIFWVAVSPERRAELKKFYDENTPWAVR
jgi:uncharacterized integral membrane protein